ncbi:MAG TPA: hypothetical protein VFD87_01400, partial [Phototrophicaceae bacterium]|nr:hypothetical protein [Phototrophicaceae bacterium]
MRQNSANERILDRNGRSPSRLIQTLGGTFSHELGIHLAGGKSSEIFKWFLASIFFGARISKVLAIRTYREFEKERLVAPEKIVDRGWHGLTVVLDRGGYVRYDFKTATKLLDVSRALLEKYDGNLNSLHRVASDARDLERRVKALGKGIGDVTVNIFLRELRGIWPKAEPSPSALALTAAKNLGLIPRTKADQRDALRLLKQKWRHGSRSRAKGFADFEAAFVRWGLALRKQSHHRKSSRVRITHG